MFDVITKPNPKGSAKINSEVDKKAKKNSRKILWPIVFLVILAASVCLGVLYKKDQDKIKLLSNPAQQAKAGNARLFNLIGQIYLLPGGETPAIATITDVDKLRVQAFFKNAQNGDKVLIYNKAKTAIIYRPDSKDPDNKPGKIINVAPINAGSSGTTGVGNAAKQ